MRNKQAIGNSFTINTGPIGCGDFNNDLNVVFVLQTLAAEHVSQKQDEIKLLGLQ